MPEQPSKQQLIIDYIKNISEQLNQQYSGIMNRDRYNRAVEIFKDSELPYEEVVNQINVLAKQVVKSYIEAREKRFNPELVKKNHEEIYSKLEILVKKLNEKGIDYQLAGALCAYIKYGVESNRIHDDIDINLNEADISKFKEACEEMGLQFHDDRLTTPRILKKGIPTGEHEVLATLDGSDFHIGAFCFERKPDRTIVNKDYYHDENGQVYTRNDIMNSELANEIFGREQVDFRGQKLTITPPEYVYRLKKYTKKDKDLVDIMFMESRIDKDKLKKIYELSKLSRIEYKKVNAFGQSFNYHTHTYRSGHSEYATDEEILQVAKSVGISMLGFSEHIPNPNLILPDEDHRMILSEVDGYIASINKMKQDNPDMTILVGFEAEFDPMKEAFLGEMRDKVDYMILGQHFVTRGLQNVSSKNNPNYPIEYANMVSKAIESGIFDIVAHPDHFMEFRDTIINEEDKKLFDENSVIASQIICEKARDMRIPIEINLFHALNNKTLSDGNLAYPHPTFWQVAQEIDGLQILKGIDAHDISAFKNVLQAEHLIGNIEQMVSDKLIQGNYNPVIARQNNPKLQEAYTKNQESALTFETHMISQIVNGTLGSVEDGLDSESLAIAAVTSLNGVMQSCVDEADKKDKTTVDEISTIIDSQDLSSKDKKGKLERKKQVINETNQVLANQQVAIENAKNNVGNAMNIGCESKYEYSNMVTQMTQQQSTTKESQKQRIEEHITSFQYSKTGEKTYTQGMGQVKQLKKENNNYNSSSGFTDALLLTLIVTFVIGVAVGVGYMLYRISIGG